MNLAQQKVPPIDDDATSATSPQKDRCGDAEEVYFQVLRQMGPTGRARLAFNLSASLRKLTEAGVRRRHPDYDQRKVRLAAFKLAIGSTLFAQVYSGEDVDP